MSADDRPRTPVLLVEDDEVLSWAVARALGHDAFEVHRAASVRAALELADRVPFPIVLSDVNLPDSSGIELVRTLRARSPHAAIVMLTGHDDRATVVSALEAGASDFLTKPVDLFELRGLLHSLAARRERQVKLIAALMDAPVPLLGRHPLIEKARAEIAFVAGHRHLSVFVTGETGTGKDVVAQAVHHLDGAGPYIDLNCGAVPESLFESELFGHEAGAFTGAKGARPGVLELAHGGTLFLDEVGDLPAALQPKLLRVLEERAFRRLGGGVVRHVDVRVVSATLREQDGAGALRRDLFFRLAGHVVRLPPLRERGDDVLLLADYVLARIAEARGQAPWTLSSQARTLLLGYPWPGNVRELRSAMERAALHAPGREIRPAHLPPEVVRGAPEESPRAAPPPSIVTPLREPTRPVARSRTEPLRPLAEVEREHLQRALEQSGGNVQAAARALGLSRSTLRDRLRKFGLSGGPPPQAPADGGDAPPSATRPPEAPADGGDAPLSVTVRRH